MDGMACSWDEAWEHEMSLEIIPQVIPWNVFFYCWTCGTLSKAQISEFILGSGSEAFIKAKEEGKGGRGGGREEEEEEGEEEEEEEEIGLLFLSLCPQTFFVFKDYPFVDVMENSW